MLSKTKSVLLNSYSSMIKKSKKIPIIFDIENWLWKLFDTSPLHQFAKFNNYIWVCWFFVKNLFNFVYLTWKLHNHYISSLHRCAWHHRLLLTAAAKESHALIERLRRAKSAWAVSCLCMSEGLIQNMQRMHRCVCVRNAFWNVRAMCGLFWACEVRSHFCTLFAAKWPELSFLILEHTRMF